MEGWNDRLIFLFLTLGQLPGNIVNAGKQSPLAVNSITFPRASCHFQFTGDGRLQILAVNDNQFTGTLPGWHTSLSDLVQFTAQNNQFVTMTHRTCRLDVMGTGELPEFKSDCDVCVCGVDDQMCKHCYA